MLELPQKSQGFFWQPSSPFGTVGFHSDSDSPTVVACLPISTLQISTVTCSNSITLELSLMVTGTGLKRHSESHCYLEEASGSEHFPLAAPVIEVSFTLPLVTASLPSAHLFNSWSEEHHS